MFLASLLLIYPTSSWLTYCPLLPCLTLSYLSVLYPYQCFYVWFVWHCFLVEGVHAVAYAFPKVRLVTTEVDPEINDHFYIIPGIGMFFKSSVSEFPLIP